MNTGQTMLSIAFFVLIVMTSISANRLILNTQSNSLEFEALEQGTNFANDLLSEILTKKFDYNAVTTKYNATGDFIRTTSLGPVNKIPTLPDVAPFKSVKGSNKASDYCYDVDDYKGYQRIIDSDQIKRFFLWVDVYYVSKSMTRQTARSYYKQIDVYVKNQIYVPGKDSIDLLRTMKISGLAAY